MTEELRIRILNTPDRMAAPETPPAGLLVWLKELDAPAGDVAAPLPGDLRHYLSRRSYDKARLFLLDAGPIPPGDCGRGSLS